MAIKFYNKKVGKEVYEFYLMIIQVVITSPLSIWRLKFEIGKWRKTCHDYSDCKDKYYHSKEFIPFKS